MGLGGHGKAPPGPDDLKLPVGAILCLALCVEATAGRAQTAGGAGSQTRIDIHIERSEALLGGRAGPGAGAAHGLGAPLLAQGPWTFEFDAVAPLYYNSNAEGLGAGGSKTWETTPEGQLSWSRQPSDSDFDFSGYVDLSADRFGKSRGADFDLLVAQARFQYKPRSDGQAWRPFVQYQAATLFAPGLRNAAPTIHKFELGVDKAFNFKAVSIGLTAFASENATAANRSSVSAAVSPSINWKMSQAWSANIRATYVSRWYHDGGERDQTTTPILTLAYAPSLTWIGASPSFTFTATYSNVRSSAAGLSFHDWQVGPALTLSWN
jgi:hypothetical protein